MRRTVQKLNLSLDGFQDLPPPSRNPLKIASLLLTNLSCSWTQICSYLIPTQKDIYDWKKNWALSKETHMGEGLSELFLFTCLVFLDEWNAPLPHFGVLCWKQCKRGLCQQNMVSVGEGRYRQCTNLLCTTEHAGEKCWKTEKNHEVLFPWWQWLHSVLFNHAATQLAIIWIDMTMSFMSCNFHGWQI